MIVCTAQLTLFDQNDAPNIDKSITASLGTSQLYRSEDATTTYTPNYASTPNVIRAHVFVNGVDVTDILSGRKWGTSQGASDLGTNVSQISKNTNLATGSPHMTIYFEGDYTDPATMLVSHITDSISLVLVREGSNAVFVLAKGQMVIVKAADGTKNTAEVTCDLMRVTGVDDTGVTYKWFKSPYTAADQLDANHPDVISEKIIFKTTSGFGTVPPADGTWADVKSIVIREDAIQEIGLFQVQAKDADGKIYSTIFTVVDYSDPYDGKIIPSNGQVFINGVGVKDCTPEIWRSGSPVDISGYTFYWWIYDKNGKKSGFIDTARTPTAKTISAHTASITGYFDISVALAAAPSAGDIIRVISADRLSVATYEVGPNSTTSRIYIRSPLNGFSSVAPTSNQYVDGKLWLCNGNGAAAGKKTTTGTTPLAVTGDDVDGQCRLVCEADNPLAS